MAEQTFKSPGFFEREIEVINKPLITNSATPVGVIGPAEKGPAFVPVTVSSDTEFMRIFGSPDQNRSPAHGILEFFENGGQAATFCRILGTGLSNKDGSSQYAGFKIDGTALSGDHDDRATGAVQFIVADHTVNDAEHVTLGIINDNDSLTTEMDENPSDGDLTGGTNKNIQLVRAMVFMHKDYTLRVRAVSEGATAQDDNDIAAVNASKLFEIVITEVAADGATAGTPVIHTVSLDPESPQYIHKVLNTDPFAFTSKFHFLYADFPIDTAIAEVANTNNVVVLRGKDTHIDKYGDFASRYTTPETTSFISQPFGSTEYDLFKIAALDDGSYAGNKYKISIADLKASVEKNYKFGTFSVLLRDLNDTDDNPIIYESYTNCSIDPDSTNYVARVVGDQRLSLSLDVDSEDEKRLIREGTFKNMSSRIRVIMSDAVVRGEVPSESLPFGFRGAPFLRTTTHGKDGQTADTDNANSRLSGRDAANVIFPGGANATDKLGYSVLPPIPYRSKVTRGKMTKDGAYFQTYFGQAILSNEKVTAESVKTSMYWGLLNTKVTDINNPNSGSSASDCSRLIENLTKFLGNDSDAVVAPGSDADSFNNNKFTLAKVAFPKANISDISGTASDAFLEAVYVRNADVDASSGIYDSSTHTIKMELSQDPFDDEDDANTDSANRASMAKLLVEDPRKFNKYSVMAKFTAPFIGGFDGVNILDRDDYYFTDRSVSTTSAENSADGNTGHANTAGYSSGLSGTTSGAMQGKNLENNAVVSYRNAVRIMTDEMIVDHNVLVVPGIRESLVTDFAARRVKNYGKAIYLMDIPHYTKDGTQTFVSSTGISTGRADVEETSSKFDAREVDSSYVATYFPDVMMIDRGDDENAKLTNQRLIRVPSSVVALGALAKSDASTRAPWFAPAGFSRGSLDAVRSIDVRLNAADRDTLYENRINPIANFPNNQFVIFGQKTTQIARTSLDRVNVRRLMVAIKRRIQKIAQRLLFQQNDAQTRSRFVSLASATLQDVQVRQGIEDYRVIMDDTNNTDEDVDNNRLNGRIVVIPTRAVEFIAMDFVITNSGVEFPS